MTRRFAALAICIVGFAQAPPKLAFEVVSVKVAVDDRDGHQSIDDAHIDIGALPMMDLLNWAFDIPWDRIKGPGWIESTNYSVRATLPAGGAKKQIPEMLQSMLMDRFKLRFHREQKILPVYELRIGSGTLKLKESAASETGHGCSGVGDRRVCHHFTMDDLAGYFSMVERVTEKAQSMGRAIPWSLDRPVIDATGLTGSYDFELGFGGSSANPDDPAAKSIRDVVESLGLKLEPARHAFDYVIVDHLERVPTEN
jgi:uncharacterized protein (TIGR03435 family)